MKLNNLARVRALASALMLLTWSLCGCEKIPQQPSAETNAHLSAIELAGRKAPNELAQLQTQDCVPRLISVSPDRRLAVGSTFITETIVYDVQQGLPVKRWPTVNNALSFSANSKRLLRVYGDQISVYDTDDMARIQTWTANPKLPTQRTSPLYLMAAISPEGQHILVANKDQCFHADSEAAYILLQVDNPESRIEVQTPLPKDDQEPPHFEFVGSENRLVFHGIQAGQKTSLLFDLQSQKTLYSTTGERTLRLAAEAELIASAQVTQRESMSELKASPGQIDIVDLNSGNVIKEIPLNGILRDFDITDSGAEVIAAVQQSDAKAPPKQIDVPQDSTGRLTTLQRFKPSTGEMIGESSELELPVCAIRYTRSGLACFVGMEYPNGYEDELSAKLGAVQIPGGKQVNDKPTMTKLAGDFLARGNRIGGAQSPGILETVKDQFLATDHAIWSASKQPFRAYEVAFAPTGNLCWFSDTLTNLATGNQRLITDLEDVQFLADGEHVFARTSNSPLIISITKGTTVWRSDFDTFIWPQQSVCTLDGRFIASIIRPSGLPNQPPKTRLLLVDRQDQDHPLWQECDAQRLCFSKDGKSLFAVGKRHVQQLSLPDGELVQEIAIPELEPRDVAVHPNGRQLFIAGQSTAPKLYFRGSARTGMLVQVNLTGNQASTLQTIKAPMNAVTISPDGSHLNAANQAQESVPGSIWQWNLDGNGQPLQRDNPAVLLESPYGINDLAFSPDSKQLLIAAGDGARLWNLQTTNETEMASKQRKLAKHFQIVEYGNSWTGQIRRANGSKATLLDKPETLDVASNKASTKLIDSQADANWPSLDLGTPTNNRRSGNVSEIERWLANGTKHPSSKPVAWNRSELAQLLERYELGPRSQDWKTRLAYESFGRERHHVLFDDQWKPIFKFPRVDNDYHGTLSASGNHVALALPRQITGLGDNVLEIQLWETETQQPRWTAEVIGTHVSGLEIDALDRYVKVNDNGGAVVVLDLMTGQQLGRYPTGRASNLISRLSPDAKLVAVASRGNSGVRLLDPQTMQQQAIIPTPSRTLWMQWLPESGHLVIGQAYGRSMSLATCWDVSNATTRWSKQVPNAQEVDLDQAGRWMLVHHRGQTSASVLLNTDNGQIHAVFAPTRLKASQRLVLSKSGGKVYQTDPSELQLWPPVDERQPD